jgi:hypothetical protein
VPQSNFLAAQDQTRPLEDSPAYSSGHRSEHRGRFDGQVGPRTFTKRRKCTHPIKPRSPIDTLQFVNRAKRNRPSDPEPRGDGTYTKSLRERMLSKKRPALRVETFPLFFFPARAWLLHVRCVPQLVSKVFETTPLFSRHDLPCLQG